MLQVFLFLFFRKENAMGKYRYDGPVMEFNTCIVNHWRGETTAPSESKARSNLIYQFKKKNHRLPSSKIALPGDLEMIG